MLLATFAALNLIAFLVFGWDKLSAMRNASRVPERVLLSLALFGGALGAIAGQQIFRHKTRKQPFAALLLGAVLINVAVALWLLPDWRGILL